jgi:tetratricopeptide (TPR) repeat protein
MENINKETRRQVVFVSILVVSATVLYFLSLRLMAGIYCYQAENFLRDGHYGLVVSALKKAVYYQPEDYKIQRELGNACLRLSELHQSGKTAFLLAEQSGNCYRRAAELNPTDAESAYGLAKAETRLEELYLHLHPDETKSPYQAMTYFEQAVRLRPNGITYHYALARYLYKKENMSELFTVVRRLIRIYPPAYPLTKKEAFWSPSVNEICKSGLLEAVRDNIYAKHAHFILSSVSAEEKNWHDAISHYEAALNNREFENTAGNYLHLGYLYLKNEQIDEAESFFLHALHISDDVEKGIERLYSYYKNEGHFEKFYQFYQKISPNFALSSKMDILIARSLTDMKVYDHAKNILTELIQKEASAEAYYWLAHIAEAEKDWDSMELAIQRATMFDPKNSQYHLIFSGVLNRLGKFDRAEEEAGLAMEYQKNPSVGFFSHRASIRWAKQDYQGAVEDWKAAIRLKPDQADFYARTAEAYLKMENRSLAGEYYLKALKLAPENAQYQKRYFEITGVKFTADFHRIF